MTTPNIWYDSEYVDAKAAENTLRVINENIKDHKDCGEVNLMDIRILSKVKMHPEVFSVGISIYYRVDLLRVLATLHLLEKEPEKYFVYADIDVDPMPESQLFDKCTVSKLEDFGIVLARNDYNGFENCFHIIAKDDKLLEAIDLILVDLSIIRAERFIEGKIRGCDEQSLYYAYYHMLWYFYDLKGWSDYSFYQNDVIEHPRWIEGILHTAKDPKVGKCCEYSSLSGILMVRSIYWPTKNVNSSTSRFSHFKCRFSPKLITSNNFEDRLNAQLVAKSFYDIPLLYVLVVNKRVKLIKKIFASFSQEEMSERFVQKCEVYLEESAAMVLLFYRDFDLLRSLIDFFDDNSRAYIIDKLRSECLELEARYKYYVTHLLSVLDTMSAQLSKY